MQLLTDLDKVKYPVKYQQNKNFFQNLIKENLVICYNMSYFWPKCDINSDIIKTRVN